MNKRKEPIKRIVGEKKIKKKYKVHKNPRQQYGDGKLFFPYYPDPERFPREQRIDL